MADFISEYRVGDDAYLLVLLSAGPNRQTVVRKELRSIFPAADVFFLWNDYDLAALIPVEDLQEASRLAGVAQVRRSHISLCYGWRMEDGRSLFSVERDLPLALIVPLKLNPVLVRRYGHRAEQAAIKMLLQRFSGLQAKVGSRQLSAGVLGTLDIHETLLILRGCDYGVLHDALREAAWGLTSHDLKIAETQRHEAVPVYERIYALAGVEGDLLAEEAVERQATGFASAEALALRVSDPRWRQAVSGNLDLKLRMRLRGSQARGIAGILDQQAKGWGPKLCHVLGDGDVEVRFEPAKGTGIPTVDLVEGWYGRLLPALAPYVQDIRVHLEFAGEVEPGTFFQPDNDAGAGQVEPPMAADALEIPVESRNVLLRMFDTYNTAVQDPVAGAAIRDLEGLVLRARRMVRSQIQGGQEAGEGTLSERIDRLGRDFVLGFRQRAHHAENAAPDLPGGLPEFPAAFQRVIVATNAVVSGLFRRFGLERSTCCIYTSGTGGRGKVPGVIRIPVASILRFEELWQLLQEAAREFVGIYPVKFLKDMTVEQVIEDIVKVGMERAVIKGMRRRRQRDWMECRGFVLDLFCDLFTFVFVYKRETELFLRTFGKRSAVRGKDDGTGMSGGLDPYYRTLFVVVFEHVVNRKLDNIDKRLFAHYLGSAEGFREMNELIRRHAGGELDVSFQTEFLPFKDMVLPMTIEVFKLVMELHREVLIQAPINVEGFEKVERGQVCYNTANPHQLVLDLWSYFYKLDVMQAGSSQKFFIGRIATLLNLWHMAVLEPEAPAGTQLGDSKPDEDPAESESPARPPEPDAPKPKRGPVARTAKGRAVAEAASAKREAGAKATRGS